MVIIFTLGQRNILIENRYRFLTYLAGPYFTMLLTAETPGSIIHLCKL